MAEAEKIAGSPPKEKSRKPMLIGFALMLLLGTGGFYTVYHGLILGGQPGAEQPEEAVPDALPDIAFVPIQAMVVSLGPEAGGRFLHFTSQLEVLKRDEADVTMLLPRILDVLNSYLRAVRTQELEDPTALVRLRAQMLRRVQIVTGENRVRDLLITEFVIN